MTERTWHYLKANESTRVPRKHIFLDTESWSDRDGPVSEQRWAIGVTCFVQTRPDRPAHDRWEVWDDPVLMWKGIDAYCGASGRTVLWTHNLGYDVRISQALHLLPELGWKLVAHNLAGRGTWLSWARGRASLRMVDSAAIFPTTLARVGASVGLGKRPLPDLPDAGIGLYSRCWRDVEILRTAVLSYLDWLETEDLGNWQSTGAGQSWAAFRHRFMDRRLLVHDDQQALAAERRAMWTGRCEAYWHGELSIANVNEWDFSLAYARIAQQYALPVRLLGPMPPDYPWMDILDSPSTALLAQVDIETDVPVVPTEDDGRILWPVGRFSTTLWDVEIRAAIEAGATVHVRRGWLYHKAPALKRWADWVIGQLEDTVDGPDDFRWIVLKHWSRALIGRFAMTYREWEEWAMAPTPDVGSRTVYDATTGETYEMVQVGRTLWKAADIVEWRESMPMVTGYVQAVGRVRLWDMIRALPPRAALYADTDSVLVGAEHHELMAGLAARHPEWGLRLKRSWDGFAVWGPRQIRTGQVVRVAGIPKTAERTGTDRYAGRVWETLGGSLARRHSDRVVTHDREWTVRKIDRRRLSSGFGWTEPIRLPAAS
jgi:hypothetical protein